MPSMQMLDMRVICIHYLMHNYTADKAAESLKPSTRSPIKVFH